MPVGAWIAADVRCRTQSPPRLAAGSPRRLVRWPRVSRSRLQCPSSAPTPCSYPRRRSQDGRALRAAQRHGIGDQLIDRLDDQWIDVAQLVEELRRPAGSIAHDLLKGSDDQAIATQPERL